MLEGSAVRILLNNNGGDHRPGTVFIGRVAAMDYSGMQVSGRWHRKAIKEDGQKEVPVGTADAHAYFPWTSLDYIDILPESEPAENQYAEHYRLGLQAVKSKDYAKAAGHFREALLLKPNDPKSKYYLEEAERLGQG